MRPVRGSVGAADPQAMEREVQIEMGVTDGAKRVLGNGAGRSRGRDRGRGAALLALLLAAATLGVLGKALHNDRERWKYNNFQDYYNWCLHFRQGADIWRPAEQASGQGARGGPVVSNYTPLFGLLFAPLTRLSPAAAHRLWLFIQLASLGVAAALMLFEAAPGLSASWLVIGVCLPFVFTPVLASLYTGDLPCFLLVLLVAAWRLDRRGSFAGAGAALAAAALLKLYPAAVGGYFLFRGRFRTLAWAALAGAVLFGASGPVYWFEFFRYQVSPLLGVVNLFVRSGTVTIYGHVWALARLVGDGPMPAWLTAARWALAILLDLGLIGLGAALTVGGARREDAIWEGLCLSLWTISALLLSPLAYTEEVALAAPALVFNFAAVTRLMGDAGPPLKFVPGFVKGLGLVLLGLAGFTTLYFWMPFSHAHAGFVSLLVLYGGVYLELGGFEGTAAMPA